jgi:membrane-bound lytic murein transglycosylase C
MYCTIAAYNTGAGNVAKSFVGSYDTKAAAKIINTMKPQQVYEYLMENLPYRETKLYLQKVRERIFTYRTWLQKQQS